MEYKGYIARIEYDDDFKCLCGSVVNSGPYSIVTFVANDAKVWSASLPSPLMSISSPAQKTVKRAKLPENPIQLKCPCPNRFTCVLGEALHERIWQAARDSGLSLDCWVAQALEHSLAAETPAPGV